MNSQQAKRSLLGLLISLLIHGAIVGALLWNWHKPSEAASNATGEISTTISMEMIQGMRVEEQAPEPEPEPQQVEPEPEKQDIVEDPTKKPEPEKKKEPEKKPEKPIEKPKPKPKEKPVEMPKNLPIGDKNINSTATANSKATTTGQPGTNGVQGGSGTNTDELNAYRAAIRREIERHKRYPARAKMMRKQGVVSVSFSVSSDGSLSGERVTNSSGDESLDNAALEAVRSARPVGPKPAGFASSVSVPISFTIQ
nr:energy transducer TonB [Haemophilus parainfluenzae]